MKDVDLSAINKENFSSELTGDTGNTSGTVPDSNDLKRIAAEKEAQRQENKKGVVHTYQILGFKLVAISIMLIFTIWVFHLIAPTSWHWLDEEVMKQIQQYAVGAGGGGAITHIAKNLIMSDK